MVSTIPQTSAEVGSDSVLGIGTVRFLVLFSKQEDTKEMYPAPSKNESFGKQPELALHLQLGKFK